MLTLKFIDQSIYHNLIFTIDKNPIIGKDLKIYKV